MLFSHFVAVVLEHLSSDFKVELCILPLVQAKNAQYQLKFLTTPSPNLQPCDQVVEVVYPHLSQYLRTQVALISVVIKAILKQALACVAVQVSFDEIDEL